MPTDGPAGRDAGMRAARQHVRSPGLGQSRARDKRVGRTIPTRTPRGKTTMPDYRSAQSFVVSLTRCAHACVLFVGFLNVLRARGDNHSSPASVYATGLSGIVSASAIVSCLAAARQRATAASPTKRFVRHMLVFVNRGVFTPERRLEEPTNRSDR